VAPGRPGHSGEAGASDLALRLAGPAGADQLLEEARQQAAAIVAEKDFRADVERIAVQLLRRRELDSEAIRELTKENRTDSD